MSTGADPAQVRVEATALERFATALLQAAGTPAGPAATVVGHLLEADRMGLRSHGIMRIPQYLADIAAGGIAPAAEPTVERRATGRAHVDGGKGFGQVAGHAMAEVAVELGRAAGVGFVTGRHMGHTGRIGAYPEAIARAGLVGIAVCSGPRSGHWVAPFGGLEGRLATNPIAFAWPGEDGIAVVADFSTSVVPEGVVRSLKHRGLSAPPGALRDATGHPTTDPAALYATPRGALQPLGDAFGYRGTALAMLVDVLAGLLALDEADDPAREGSNLAMLALAADDGFAGRATRMADYLKATPPIDPARPVLLPGERERLARQAQGDGPILVDGPTWTAMVALAGGRIALPDRLPD